MTEVVLDGRRTVIGGQLLSIDGVQCHPFGICETTADAQNFLCIFNNLHTPRSLHTGHGFTSGKNNVV